MRAAAILTSFIASLGATQSTIDPITYDIFQDPFHIELHNHTLAEHKGSHLVARQAKKNFIRSAGILTVAGYSYRYGGNDFKLFLDSCFEVQGGNTYTKGDCAQNAVRLLSAYAIVGVAAYEGPTACVGLMTKSIGLANTLRGNQGQGSSVKRASIDSPFQYGAANMSDSMIDAMNHGVAVARQQKEVKADPKLRQACDERNGNLYQTGHHWYWTAGSGMKMQCKNGCGNGNWNSNDMAELFRRLSTTVILHGDMNAQFTVYNNQNGRVFARCKVTFLRGQSDTCPEFIEGRGCNF